MEDKEFEDGIFKVVRKKKNHMNTKINKDGTRKAMQFTDENNGLDGPVDLMEVDIDELIKQSTSMDIHPLVKLVIDDIFAPLIDYGLHRGADKFLQLLSTKGIPVAKKAVKELSENTGFYVDAFKDAMAGKETKVNRLLREAEMKKATVLTEVESNKERNEQSKETRSPEEVQQVLEVLRKSVLVTATCIRILTNTIVKDDGANPETIEETKKQLEKLSSREVKNQINLMLEEKNRCLLDESSYQILSAFRSGKLIVQDKEVPISRYLNYDH